MSYSRWGNSYWYTFWLSQEEEDYDTATFCICCVADFEAKQLREDFDGCIASIRSIDKNVSNEEINELRGYIREFLEDVDSTYKTQKS